MIVVRYLAERFRPPMFGPVAAAIALAASGGHIGGAALAAGTVAAALLLLEFRVWDDLADRTVDRVRCPQRVVVTASSVGPFVATIIAAGTINFVWASRRAGLVSLGALAALHVVLAIWYWRRGGRSIAGDQLLLAKYPAFVFVVAGNRFVEAPLTVATSAVAVYVAATLYEAWHDPESSVASAYPLAASALRRKPHELVSREHS